MSECQTIDDMLQDLQEYKRIHGSKCRVLVRVGTDGLRIPYVGSAATGKSNDWRLVSRGGNPCVLISD